MFGNSCITAYCADCISVSKSWGVLSKMRQAVRVMHMSITCPAASLVLSRVRLHILYTPRSHRSGSVEPLYPRHPLALPLPYELPLPQLLLICLLSIVNNNPRGRKHPCMQALKEVFMGSFCLGQQMCVCVCVCVVCLRGIGGSLVSHRLHFELIYYCGASLLLSQ